MFNPINPDVYNDKARLKAGLQQPCYIVHDALVADVAEELYAELMAAGRWERQSLTEPGFVYQRDKIGMGSADAPPVLNRLHAFLAGAECLKWISEVSGRRCDDFHGAAAVFNPGDQISEHNDRFVFTKSDGCRAVRMVTFNLYLSKHWEAAWGGRLVWKNPRMEIVPSFNTLVLFNVGEDTHHWVEPIAPGVTEKRLSVTGWFLNTPDRNDALKRKLKLKI